MNGKTKAPSPLVFCVAHLIEARQENGSDIRAIGRELGMSHSMASGICSNLKGIGSDKERALAKALFGGSLDRLNRAAERWRAAHPNWLPRAYKERHASGDIVPSRATWEWWPPLAERAAAQKPEWAWAIWAAGNEPRGNEPRLDKRTVAYVLGLAEMMLSLPDEVQGELNHEYRNRPETPGSQRDSGMHVTSR